MGSKYYTCDQQICLKSLYQDKGKVVQPYLFSTFTPNGGSPSLPLSPWFHDAMWWKNCQHQKECSLRERAQSSMSITEGNVWLLGYGPPLPPRKETFEDLGRHWFYICIQMICIFTHDACLYVRCLSLSYTIPAVDRSIDQSINQSINILYMFTHVINQSLLNQWIRHLNQNH